MRGLRSRKPIGFRQWVVHLHGIQIKTNSQNYRPDILGNIKESRNNLAHGSVSFVEAVRDNSIIDIETNVRFITAFLEELINTIVEFIENEKYKIQV